MLIGDEIEQVAFIYDAETTLTNKVKASFSNQTFKANIGPLVLYIKNGSATLNDTGNPASSGYATFAFTISDNDLNGRHYFTENLLASTNMGLSGAAKTSLPIYYPSLDADQFGTLTVNLPSLSNFVNGVLTGITVSAPNLGNTGGLLATAVTLMGMLLDPEILADGLDLALQTIQDALNEQIFSIRLPFIGDGLASLPLAQFLDNLRTNLLTELARAVRNAPSDLDANGTVNLVASVLFGILGSAGFGSATGYSVLKDLNGSGGITEDDIIVTSDDQIQAYCGGTATYCQFNMYLGDTITITSGVPFDIGPLDGLGFDYDTDLNITYTWDLYFGFGINLTDGFYVDVRDNLLTDDTDGFGQPYGPQAGITLKPANDLNINIVATIPAGSHPGHLGFFMPMDAADRSGECNDYFPTYGVYDAYGQIVPGDPGSSCFYGDFTVNLKDPNNDGKLTFAEMADPQHTVVGNGFCYVERSFLYPPGRADRLRWLSKIPSYCDGISSSMGF